MKKILLTGATGFVGQALVDTLCGAKYKITALVRKHSFALPETVTQVVAGDLKTWSSENSLFSENIGEALHDVNTIIHMAARVHMMVDRSHDPLAEFRAANRDATLAIANKAASTGVKRFIFISSIKVNGEMTQLNKPFRPDDEHVPTDAYGLSKYEAEQALLDLSKETDMELVIIRPPLVYGPGVGANFASMLKWVDKGIPLPFGAIYNRRSLVAIDNLTHFILHCVDNPKAANEIFMISDCEDVSTTVLLKRVAAALNRSVWLIPVPVFLMSLIGKLLGKGDITEKLFGSLQVDSSKSTSLLNWEPVISMHDQLKKTADEYFVNEKNL